VTIFLFTDFGAADLYVGQVKAVLAQNAPHAPVIDLLHEAPPYNVRAGAHLLAALTARLPPHSVTMAVVDPGVGGDRDAIAADIDGRWLLGPDNGLLTVAGARSASCAYWRITWQPEQLSVSFHGRDLFAPVAAAIANGDFPGCSAEPIAAPGIQFGAGDLGEIVYIDHYGNAITGLRARDIPPAACFAVGDHRVRQARVFSAAAPGQEFWYENSLGLAEIAANRCSASAKLGLAVGDVVSIAI
jgi:S-adenosylmethionine hydrolase